MKFNLPICAGCSQPENCHSCMILHEWVDEHILQESFPVASISDSCANTAKECDFAFRMVGSGMAPAILDGDIVFCRKQSSVRTNDIAIAKINDELRIGRAVCFHNFIVLLPLSADYDVTLVQNQADGHAASSIIGIALALNRSLAAKHENEPVRKDD